MDWKKAPDDLVELLARKTKRIKCDYRKMFGYPAYFINGNMFTGVHGEKVFLRLPEQSIEELRRDKPEVVAFEPVAGRQMKGYVTLPKIIYCNDKLFDEWLDKSVDYVSSLPRKKKKEK